MRASVADWRSPDTPDWGVPTPTVNGAVGHELLDDVAKPSLVIRGTGLLRRDNDEVVVEPREVPGFLAVVHQLERVQLDRRGERGGQAQLRVRAVLWGDPGRRVGELHGKAGPCCIHRQGIDAG
jgi:hypothetical protein